MIDRIDRKDQKKIDLPNNETYERIMDVAEELFGKRGYAAVTLRDIATEVGMRQASLYYYAPEGKEQLFMQVMERNYTRHRQGLEQAAAEAGPDLSQRLRAMAAWSLSQPPADYGRVLFSDMPALRADHAESIGRFADSSLVEPIEAVLSEAIQAGTIETIDTNLAAHVFTAVIQSLHSIPDFYGVSRVEEAERAIEMLLHGWLKR